MTETEVRQLFVDTGAILEGHFLLTSGLHSQLYVEKFQVLQYPQHTASLCAALAERYKDQNIELVVGPVTGGVLLAHEVGKNLGTRAIFTERENGKMALRRGFVIEPGQRVLIVTRVFPEPAPATTSRGAPACTTALRCGSLSPSSSSSGEGPRRPR
jgi:orotate phosphoribosyltransferase